MKQILLPLIAASCVTETAAWGYGRVAWNGRFLIYPTNSYVRAHHYNLGLYYNYQLRPRNGGCFIGAGVYTDHQYIWLNDFCGNNGWLVRCSRWDMGWNNCWHITRQGGYGGFAMASYGHYGKRNYGMVWAARYPYPDGRRPYSSWRWPSRDYAQRDMKYLVFGNRHMSRYNWYCYVGSSGYGVADISLVDRWRYGGQLLLLLNINNPHAYMYEWTRRVITHRRRTHYSTRSCTYRRYHYQSNVCPGSQVWGMEYVTGRRRFGWTYFTCKSRYGIKKRNLYWSHYYRGHLRGIGVHIDPTTTTTTTTVPITMRTWSFPETLSWTIQETRRRKRVCRGGNYAGWYEALKINGCKLKTGWHKITCSDKVKEGWHGAWLQVKNYKLCKKKFEWGAGRTKVEKFYVRR